MIDDEEDFFRRGFSQVQWCGYHRVLDEQPKEENMEREIPTPRRPMKLINHPEIHPGWACNARKRHNKENDNCLCSECIRAQHPYLSEGDPVQVNGDDQWAPDQLKKSGLVGLYNPVIVIERERERDDRVSQHSDGAQVHRGNGARAGEGSAGVGEPTQDNDGTDCGGVPAEPASRGNGRSPITGG